jgi:Protein of unknown function (DUF2975)
MKIFKTNVAAILITLIILISVIVYGYLSPKFSSSNFTSTTTSFPEVNGNYNDTAFGGIFATENINDSLPYYEYKKLKTDFDIIYDEIKRENEGGFMSGMSFGEVGINYGPNPMGNLERIKIRNENFKKIIDLEDSLYIQKTSTNNITLEKNNLFKKQTDSLNHRVVQTNTFSSDDTNQVYYFSLKGYKLKQNKHEFFIQNGKYYLTQIVIDSTKKSGTTIYNKAHYERIEIPYRYNKSQESLQIPISKTLFKFLENLGKFTFVILPLIYIFFIFGLPLQLILNIAKGKVFTLKNLARLKTLSILMLIFTLISIFFPLVCHFLMFSNSSKFFNHSSILERIFLNYSSVTCTLVLFAIKAAFNKGYKLQEEQNLII